MTRRDGGDYVVGYRRPPEAHQFKKGQSGNPNGRPRKQTNEYDGLRNTTDQTLLLEANRVVTIRENGRSSRMPFRQALTRSAILMALKGDNKGSAGSLRALSEIAKAEEKLHARVNETLGNIERYRDYWEYKRDYAVWKGREPPLLLPHPDDLQTCMSTGEIWINGPIDQSEKIVWDRCEIRRRELKADIQNLELAAQKLLDNKSEYRELETDTREWLLDDVRFWADARRKCIGILDYKHPDEATRRRPGFCLELWTKQHPARRLVARLRRNKRNGPIPCRSETASVLDRSELLEL